MSYDPDPEVLADLHLRASSERDASRTRGDGVYDWRRNDTADVWGCRSSSCSGTVDVGQEVVDGLEVFNRRLREQREAQIEPHRVAFCADCRAMGAKLAAERNRKHVDALAELIRRLAADPPPSLPDEYDLIEKIKLMRHPDVEGLIGAIRARREQARPGARKAGRL